MKTIITDREEILKNSKYMKDLKFENYVKKDHG